jgi:hypothetical protein
MISEIGFLFRKLQLIDLHITNKYHFLIKKEKPPKLHSFSLTHCGNKLILFGGNDSVKFYN